MRSERSIVPCRFSPTMTRMRGEPFNPSRSTSQPALAQHVVARSRERGEVRHLPAGDEAERGVARKAEQLEEPRARDLLDDRGRRAADVEARVLVPRGGEPVRGERRGHGTADHEAEVAARRLGDEARVGGGRELLDHLTVGRTAPRAAARRTPRAAPRTVARGNTGRSGSDS